MIPRKMLLDIAKIEQGAIIDLSKIVKSLEIKQF